MPSRRKKRAAAYELIKRLVDEVFGEDEDDEREEDEDDRPRRRRSRDRNDD